MTDKDINNNLLKKTTPTQIFKKLIGFPVLEKIIKLGCRWAPQPYGSSRHTGKEGVWISGKQIVWAVSKCDVQLPQRLQTGEYQTSRIALLFYMLQMCQTAELFRAVDRGLDFFLALT